MINFQKVSVTMLWTEDGNYPHELPTHKFHAVDNSPFNLDKIPFPQKQNPLTVFLAKLYIPDPNEFTVINHWQQFCR